LTGASLYGANLSYADLTKTNFTDANLNHTILSWSKGLMWASCGWAGGPGNVLLAAKIKEKDIYFCHPFQGSFVELLEYIANDDPKLAPSRILWAEQGRRKLFLWGHITSWRQSKMSMTTDKNLSVNYQALAVLNVLSAHEFEKVNSSAYAWYNGRERGVVLVVDPPSGNESQLQLCIAWAESRNSDSIVIYYWYRSPELNPPTATDVPEEVWQCPIFVGLLDVGMAVRKILELVEDFVEAPSPELW